MAFDVPVVSHYGALVTNDSFKVLIRKNAKADEGLFFRWRCESGIAADLLVRSRLDNDFGVSVELIQGPDGIIFIKGGSLANFIVRYTGGDIDAVGLQWVSLKSARELVLKLDDHELLLTDSTSLSALDGWIRSQRRKIAIEAFDTEQRKWFEKFDRLCERVRNVLDRDSIYYGGVGLYSDYIKSSIRSGTSKINAQTDSNLYLTSLFDRAMRPGRSSVREKDLIEAIHASLAISCVGLYGAKYDYHVKGCRATLIFLTALEEIYGGNSSEIRRRAIKGGSERWRGHIKADRVKAKIKSDQVKAVETVILKVLENKRLYRKTDRIDVIAGKIVGVVLSEILVLGLGDLFVGKDLQLFIWDFISENKAAKILIK